MLKIQLAERRGSDRGLQNLTGNQANYEDYTKSIHLHQNMETRVIDPIWGERRESCIYCLLVPQGDPETQSPKRAAFSGRVFIDHYKRD